MFHVTQKIFVDLHKKKQSSQNYQNRLTTDNEGPIKTSYSLKSDPSTYEELPQLGTVQGSHLSSNFLMLRDSVDSTVVQQEKLQNPVNSPSLAGTNFEKNNVLNVSENLDTVSSTDSTLSLLNNVSLKLKNYLMSEIEETEIDQSKSKSMNVLDEKLKLEDKDNSIKVHCTDSVNNQTEELQNGKLNEITQDKGCMDFSENQTIGPTEETDDKKLAYTIVETDIKRMIKELLQESKDLKTTIVATGIQEEPTPSFTQLSKSFDSFLICRNLCNELINVACSKHICSLKARKHLNVTFKRDIEQEVESILTSLLENVLTRKSSLQQVCVNFCLVQSNPRRKIKRYVLDTGTIKYRDSSVYILTKKLYSLEPPVKKKMYPPKVTVRNLSTSKRIKFVTAENSLTSRIRRSAALLMALYDEMRDYSYYSCTSNILCDLYESMIKQGLISLTNIKQEKSVENAPPRENILANSTNENSNQERRIISAPSSTTTFSYMNNPCSSSCRNPSNISDLTESVSNNSLSSESEDEDTTRKLILPNLKYTYQSVEEINTPEEVKEIDDNVNQNGNCRDVNIKDFNPRSDESVSVHYENVTINENEAFIKDKYMQ